VSLLGVSEFAFAGAGHRPDFASNTDSRVKAVYRVRP